MEEEEEEEGSKIKREEAEKKEGERRESGQRVNELQDVSTEIIIKKQGKGTGNPKQLT